MTASPSSSRNSIPNLDEFLKSFSSQEPVGSSLRYSVLYDEVRLARQEDDPRLSMGIWETDLKRADWNKIETLCIEALLKTSKDLQIAAWLAEAWTSLDDVGGYTRGIQLLTGLSQTFWPSIYPQLPEDGDVENRYMIFEWLDNALSSRLLLVPLTQSKFDQSAFGLGFLKSAQHSDASERRQEKKTKPSAAHPDPSKTLGTVEEFQRSLDQTPDSFLKQLQENLELASQATQTLKITLVPLLEASAPSFSRLLGTLKDMERLIHTTVQSRQPPPPVSEEEPTSSFNDDAPPSLPLSSPEKLYLKTREDAYRQLNAIATFLETNDPHSLAPQLIRQLIRWENKNIMDIFGEIAKTPQEFDILKKILGSPSVKG